MPTTIGDVIQQKKQNDQAEAQAEAAAAANQAHANARASAAAGAATLKRALARTGPAFVQNPDGSVEVYMPDATDAGFHTLNPVAVGTPVELADDPTPAS